MASTRPIDDIVQETQRIVNTADERGLTLRLFGGMAIRFHCPSATHRGLLRKYADIDLMGLTKQSKSIKKLFIDLGYVPREIFNKMQGNRLIFNDLEHGRRVDIFLDKIEMCHRFNFANRLSIDKPTTSLADLLATKLSEIFVAADTHLANAAKKEGFEGFNIETVQDAETLLQKIEEENHDEAGD